MDAFWPAMFSPNKRRYNSMKSVPILCMTYCICLLLSPSDQRTVSELTRRRATSNYEWRTCPRSLHGGWSGIRTCNLPDTRHQTYHWTITPHILLLLYATESSAFYSAPSHRLTTCQAYLHLLWLELLASEKLFLVTGRCHLPIDLGPCISNLTRWYYSALAKKCMRFVYGGCGGNRNRLVLNFRILYSYLLNFPPTFLFYY